MIPAKREILRAAALLPLCFTGCGPAAPAKPAAASTTAGPGDAHPVRTAIARVAPWPAVLRVPGNLEVDERSTLGAKVGGKVVDLLVDVGSVVNRGDVLARVDSRDYQLAMMQAQGEVHEARATLGLPLAGDEDGVDAEDTAQVRLARAVLAEASAKRARAATLKEKEIIGDAEFDEAEAAAKVAEEQVRNAMQEVAGLRAQLEQRRVALALAMKELADTAVLAPYDGVVLRRLVGHGEFVNPGAPVVDLVRIDPLRLRVEVPERDAPRVTEGLSLRFQIEGDERVYDAVLSRIPPELDRASRSLFVEAEVANPRTNGAYPLRAGSFARVTIVLDPNATALAVPQSAIRSFAGVDRVVLFEDGVAKEALVTLGRRDEGQVEILAGVPEGSRVILEPGSLSTGRAVRATD